jgi:hypothetical protein
LLRLYPILCQGLAILYVVFICFIGFVNMLFSGKRTLKNIDGGPEEKIKELSDVLVKRRKAFLDQATISTEITAFQILDDVAKVSIQLQYLTSQVSDAGR